MKSDIAFAKLPIKGDHESKSNEATLHRPTADWLLHVLGVSPGVHSALVRSVCEDG